MIVNAVWFPIALIVLDVIAGIAYLLDGDFRRAIYWTAAAVLTICITV